MTNGTINSMKSTSIRPTLSVLARVGRHQAPNSKAEAKDIAYPLFDSLQREKPRSATTTNKPMRAPGSKQPYDPNCRLD